MLMHLSAAIPGLLHGHFTGFVNFVHQFQVCTFVAGSTRSTRGIFSASAILQMELETSVFRVCERTRYIQLVNMQVLANWQQRRQ